MAKKLFLTSSVHAVAEDIAKRITDLKTRNKLVFINTPAEVKHGDMQWLKNDRDALVNAGFVVTDYTITGKTKNEISSDLEKYDFIYASGGDSPYFLKKSIESGFVELVRDYILGGKKTYIGTSAGSIIASPKLPNYYAEDIEELGLTNVQAFNLVNFLVVPHWGRPDFEDKYLKDRLKMAYVEDQLPLFLLTDYQYMEVIDSNVIVHDVKKGF